MVAAQALLAPALQGVLVPGDTQWLQAGWGATRHMSRWRPLGHREDGCLPMCPLALLGHPGSREE